MDDVKKTIEEKFVDGLMYMASNPKKVLATFGMAAWTMLVYRVGRQKGTASILRKANILIIKGER